MAAEPPKTGAGSSDQPSSQQANAQNGTPTADPTSGSASGKPIAAGASGANVGPPAELPSFAAAQRQLQEQAQAGKQKPETPFSSPTAAADEVKRTDFASMSSVDCAKTVILEATKTAVVESALAMHGGDTKAVAVTVAEALQGVFCKDFLTETPSQARPATAGSLDSTPDSFASKMVTDAVLASMASPDQKRASDKQGSQLIKYAPHMPHFPGVKCRDEPDLWEDYWEKVLTLQHTLKCPDYFIAMMIKHNAEKKHKSVSDPTAFEVSRWNV